VITHKAMLDPIPTIEPCFHRPAEWVTSEKTSARHQVVWEAYLDNAKMLRPELMKVAGFVDNIRYKSLTREGWILSLSGWRDEKAVVRWRTTMRHHMAQEKGRSEILRDYHLRVGQITQDTRIPEGYTLQEQRLDETEVGEGTVTLIDAKQPAQWAETQNAGNCSKYLGLNPNAGGLVATDLLDRSPSS
jgi:heme-degrading monooxygenase HmoA